MLVSIVRRMFTIHQLAHFLDKRIGKGFRKIQSKIVGYNR